MRVSTNQNPSLADGLITIPSSELESLDSLIDWQVICESLKSYINCPIFCIYAEDDPLTKRFHKKFHRWVAFASDLRLRILDSGGYYFAENAPVDTAKLIVQN